MRNIEFNKVRDFSGILNITFEYLKNHFKPFTVILITIAGPFVFLTGIVQSVYSVNIFSMGNGLDEYIINMTIYLLFMMLSIIIIMAVSYEYVLLSKLKNEDEIITVPEVIEKIKDNIFIYLFSIVGSFIFIFGGVLLFVIPGIYLSVVLTLIYIVRINENKSFIEGFRRCRYLIKNRWWLTFGIILIFSMIQYFFSFILQFPALIITVMEIVSGTDNSNPSSLMEVVTIITSILSSLSLLFYSLSVVGIIFHYFSLVEQKDATGLLEKIESM